MKNKLFAFCFLITLCFLTSYVGGEESSNWTVTRKGKKQSIQGRVTAIRSGKVTILTDGGKSGSIPIESLVPKDRKRALISRAGSGVVFLTTTDSDGDDLGLGSGFVLSRKRKLVATNFHVVEGAYKVKVAFRDSEESAQVIACVAVDSENDLALLQLDRMPKDIHEFQVNSNSDLQPGDAVWTIGHPRGLKDTVSWGEINAYRKTADLPEQIQEFLDAPKTTRWIQTDAVIARGSSGGPLLDPTGRLIGVNTFIAGPSLGFSVHSDRVVKLAKMMAKSSPSSLPIPPSKKDSLMGWLAPKNAKLSSTIDTIMEKTLEGNAPREQMIRNVESIRDSFSDKYASLVTDSSHDDWTRMQACVLSCSLAGDSDKAESRIKEMCNFAYSNFHDTAWMNDLIGVLASRTTDTSLEFLNKVYGESQGDEERRFMAALALTKNHLSSLNSDELLTATKVSQHRKQAEKIIGEIKDIAKDDEDYANVAESLKELMETVPVGLPPQKTSGVDNDGERFKLDEYKGKVIVLDFFANWCPHCKAMYAHNRKMVEEYASRPFALIGVSCDSERILEQLTDNKTVTWRSFADGENGPIAQDWEVNGFPHVVLIDAEWRVRRVYNGNPGDSLQKDVEALIKEAESAN